MAVCKRCNSEVSDEARFCTSCGAVIDHKPENVEKQETVKEDTEKIVKSPETVENEKVTAEKSEETFSENETVIFDATLGIGSDMSDKSDTVKNAGSSDNYSYTPVAPPPNIQNFNNERQNVKAQYEQPKYRPQVTQTDVEPSENSKYAPVSTGKWFGITLLLIIPLVNLVTWIVLLCSKNVNLKNYAKAMLIWIIIGVVSVIATTALALTVFKGTVTGIIDNIKSNSSSIISIYE